MFSKKNLYILLIFIVLSSLILTQVKPARRCTQCDCPIYIDKENSDELKIFRESLIVRMFSPNTSFLHLMCVEQYLKEHPLERDAEGNIIPKH